MRSGKSIVELAQELVRIKKSKQDYIVPTSRLGMSEKGKLTFQNGQLHNFDLTSWSSQQLATFAEIPAQYFRRIQAENPKLLAENVNHGLNKIANTEENSGRMLRTIDGSVRGFLSPRYRILDAHDLLDAALPMLLENEFEVVSSEVTEKRLYLKTTSPKIQGEVKTGDVVQYGVMLSTSDVGAGSLKVEPFLNRLVCLNGMVMSSTFRKAHLGSNKYENEIQELLTDSTRELNNQAFFATVRDYLASTIRPENFSREIEKLKQATGDQIKNYKLEQVVDLTMKRVGITGEGNKKSILDALASGNEGAGLTRWGLANSFTRAAQNEALDYDEATELERAGGMIIDLSPSQWRSIAEVPA